ncbi:MAG TPA: hypothetical protein PLD84_10220 [Chitinophagales bacterium]|nr:hypothetical protein [Chitinophagales bacterium]
MNQVMLTPDELPIAENAIATILLAGYPDFLVADGNTVWVTNINCIDQIKLGSDVPVKSVDMPQPCGAGVAAFGSLWIAGCQDKSIYRIDKNTGEIISIIPTGLADPFGELSIAAGAGAVWVLSDKEGTLSGIDPETNTVVKNITVKPGSSCAVFGFGSVWVSNPDAGEDRGSVQRIDPVRNRVIATIPAGPVPHFLAAGEGGVWTLNQGDGTVSRIDPELNKQVKTIEVGAEGSGGDIATGGGHVWVRATKVLLSAIDPSTNKVTTVYGPPSGSGAVRVTADNVIWLSAHDVHTVWAIHK